MARKILTNTLVTDMKQIRKMNIMKIILADILTSCQSFRLAHLILFFFVILLLPDSQYIDQAGLKPASNFSACASHGLGLQVYVTCTTNDPALHFADKEMEVQRQAVFFCFSLIALD